jgi:NhaC family Na+:H+ antiporter
MARPDEPQPFTLVEAIIPIASLILLVALSYYLFGDAGASGPNQVGLVLATMIAVFLAWRRGFAAPWLSEAARVLCSINAAQDAI